VPATRHRRRPGGKRRTAGRPRRAGGRVVARVVRRRVVRRRGDTTWRWVGDWRHAAQCARRHSARHSASSPPSPSRRDGHWLATMPPVAEHRHRPGHGRRYPLGGGPPAGQVVPDGQRLLRAGSGRGDRHDPVCDPVARPVMWSVHSTPPGRCRPTHGWPAQPVTTSPRCGHDGRRTEAELKSGLSGP